MRGFVRSFLVLGVIWGMYGLFLYSMQGHGSTVTTTTDKGIVAGASSTKSTYRDEYIDEINSARAIAGVSSVQTDSALMKITSTRLVDMQVQQYYAHESPDGKIFTNYFAQNSVSKSTYACENLLLGPITDPSQVVTAWLQSESHKKCLLDPNMNSLGFAKASFTDDQSEQLYVLILAQR